MGELPKACPIVFVGGSQTLPTFHELQIQAGSQHVMMLLGRTRAVLAQLAQAQQAQMRQLERIDQLQAEWAAIAGCKPVGGFLTPYELGLLVNPQALDAHR